MRTNATRLRENLYKLLDEALASGETIEVERKGRILRIVPDRPGSKLDRLIPHPDAVIGDPGDLVHLDWSECWNP
jgi:antitoxin (DNA-binding transcriptional repressor) of toxin-antitoxin stability system